MARTPFPPGFRFHPTDVELVMYYLLRKVTGKKLLLEPISELNIYQFSPWDLPDKSCWKAKDLEWYFFCPRERKYSSGARMNRATESGYWKATGRDRAISYNNRVVGMAKTLVFHEGNAPQGKRTDWVLHEYRLEDSKLADAGVVQDSFVLCKVFKKCGLGPKNGAQYGAPFKEEEWDADDFDTSVLPSDALLPLVDTLPEAQNCSVATSMAAPGSGCRPLLIEPAESKIQSSSNTGLPNAQNYSLAINMVAPGNASPYVNDHSTDEAEDIARLLSAFSEDALLENCNFQLGDLIGDGNNVAGSVSFSCSQDVCNLDCRVDAPAPANEYWLNQNNLLQPNEMTFLELNDLGASHAFSKPEPYSIGLYEAFTPFEAQQSVFPGLANPNSNSYQSFYNDPFFGHQTNIPVPSETPMLSNSSDGLLDSLVFPQTAKSYTKNLPQGGGTTNQFYPTSDSHPGNVRGAGGIQD